MENILGNIKKSSLITLFVLVGFIATFIISVFANLIFGSISPVLMNYNPLLNGFIHADPGHLLYNLFMLFVFMLFPINQGYGYKDFYIVTLIISLIAFPISVLAGLPAVGISGTLYFMMSRSCVNSKSIFLYIFLGGSILYEFVNVFETSDGIAHYVHVIGAVLGYLSLKEKFGYLKPTETKNQA